ncbi:helix-turn-helix transcriptional regulator [Pseudoclavibacter sp. 13-3]|uniref:helix-turn-helix transcriptional regulator n=1 Tax=Pseudoclavibacter sp. 13-3 TaxID=2901228 RepID=UPI001E2D8388|nr:LuxR C-terminal-related transcriptional regulator [Pseudoclavibacter sp. 13-3]
MVLLGPSGCGKTTALADWAHSQPDDGTMRLWIAVDDGSRTREQFWRLVAERLTRAGLMPGLDAQRPIGLATDSRDPLPVQIARVLSAKNTRVVLMVDRGEDLIDPQIANDFLMLSSRCPALSLVITAHTIPLGMDADLHAAGAAIIRADEFSLTVDECRQLLMREVGPQAVPLASHLREQTGGWPMPVRLVLAELEHTRAPEWDALITSTTVAFIESRVLGDAQMPGAAEFITLTSFAETFSIDQAAQMAEVSPTEAERIIDTLHRQGLGTWLPWDGSPQGLFRYHRMIVDVAATRQAEISAARRRCIHRLVATWAERREDWRTAILHAARGRDMARLNALISDHLHATLMAIDAEIAESFNEIDLDTMRSEPLVLYMRGLMRMVSATKARQGAVELTEAARVAMQQVPNARGRRRTTLLSMISVVQRITGEWDDLGKTLLRLENQLDEFDAQPGLIAPDVEEYQRLQAALGHLRLGESAQARVQVMHALQKSDASRPTLSRGSALGLMACQQAFEGHLYESEELVSKGFAQQRPYGWQSSYNGLHLRLAAATIALERGDQRLMDEHLDAVYPHLPRSEYWSDAVPLIGWGLMVTRGIGAANAFIFQQVEMHAAGAPSSPAAQQQLHGLWAGACATGGLMPQAEQHLVGVDPKLAPVRLARVIIALQTSRYDAAAADGITLATDTTVALRGRVTGSLFAAAALWQKGQQEVALRYYDAASEAALRDGLSLPHRMLPATIGCEMLDDWRLRHPAALDETEHALIELWGRPIGATPREQVDLTPREIEVLRLLKQGGTTSSMAADLHVTVNTVKTQRTSLYRKLGVKNRDDALNRAYELGLFVSDSADPGSGTAL